MKDIQFKALEESELPQLAAWLASPHVAIWWNSPADRSAFAAKYAPRMHEDSAVSVYIISAGGEPVGIIQSEQLDESGSYGVDLLIGKPELTGQGLGTAVIEAFVRQYVFGRHAASCCVADPAVANTQSIRAFEKAGFVPIKTFSENGEMHILLELRPSN